MREPPHYHQLLAIDRDLRRFQRDLDGIGRSADHNVARLIAFIHDHVFDRRLNVQRAKTACGIRDNNVSTRFRQAIGMTARAYIEHLRIDAAAQLLRSHRIGVLDIALAVGYEHPQTFYLAFRRQHACTPSRYRRRQAPCGTRDRRS